MKQLIDKLFLNKALSRQEFSALIAAANDESLREYAAELAAAERDRVFGRKVFLRGLCEISNHCKNNCYYCGIRRDCAITRYRLSPAEILAALRRGYSMGFRSFVLQGGEDEYYTDDRLTALIAQIKREMPYCALSLSLGERTERSYKALYGAGADRYLLRHETADVEHYRRLHPEPLSLQNRKNCLFTLKRIGFQVGAGMMIGSPGQTADTLAEDMFFLHELQPHMCGIGPFLPASGTPFEHEPAGSLPLTLFMLSLTRIMLPYVLLPSTTALATLDKRGRILGLNAGANVLMPNLTPPMQASGYRLYDNKTYTGPESGSKLDTLFEQLSGAGYTADLGRGDSPVAATPPKR